MMVMEGGGGTGGGGGGGGGVALDMCDSFPSTEKTELYFLNLWIFHGVSASNYDYVEKSNSPGVGHSFSVKCS